MRYCGPKPTNWDWGNSGDIVPSVAIASDHRGFALKEYLIAHFDWNWIDEGPAMIGDVDYVEYAAAVGQLVLEPKVDFGILICGSGYGMCMAANRINGVRAAVCRDYNEVFTTRTHNDANVLCIGADYTTDVHMLEEMVSSFVKTEAADESRHIRRRAQLDAIQLVDIDL